MKPNAAPIRIVDRIGKKVIQVYKHGGQHDEPGAAPLLPKENPCDCRRRKRVKKVMSD